MKKLLIVLVAVIVLASCAGIPTRNRVCIEDAVKQNQERSENLERMHEEPRMNETCEEVIVEEWKNRPETENVIYFRCYVADPIDDEDYAMLLNMHMRGLRIDIGSCLTR